MLLGMTSLFQGTAGDVRGVIPGSATPKHPPLICRGIRKNISLLDQAPINCTAWNKDKPVGAWPFTFPLALPGR